ncbi:carbamoyltransferase family protein [Mycobacterium haemophilum]|uniref:Carbamoyl transferase n=1 Tax=Mycobacterium haemophilum TaxID=29311 RepID=A0A0I9U146_9MYCO|nr:carbamoyltransferase C-terminal domain-containing protein [Mycobacterium haemophilum]KLO29200.1 hypothetical protein ABH39_12750 [Mycobacterium haemophilum]KLO35804.1 hypothetical protein ABH38_14590 [Mycobacterium haemophilum]KLO41324.1 hypothetical protein ABH37_13890 [Mycobacterium haemophilum]KLO49205.1 hypothetical protein ABH36_13695 [Mycobacterium haemophilum]
MIVLGVNGWGDGRGAGHDDPAAALVVDGRLVAFVEEERLNRVRHSRSMLPVLAVDYVLREGGIELDDVDVVACGWDLPRLNNLRGRSWDLDDAQFVRRITGQQPHRIPRVCWVAHHDAHAASVFLWSGLASAAVLIADGRGEDTSISIYRARGNKLEFARSWPFEQSLGLFYQSVGEHCGFGRYDAGKTMGLASYGRAGTRPFMSWRDDDIVTPVPPCDRASAVHRSWDALLDRRYGPPVRIAPGFDTLRSRPIRHDVDVANLKPGVAADAQAAVDDLMFALARYALQTTGEHDLCVAGGVALNCVANGSLVDRGVPLHLMPAPHDAGVALGAALLVSAQHGLSIKHDGRTDLGPGYSSGMIRDHLVHTGFDVVELDDPAEAAAERLSRGQVLGWFQGRAEVGPRALGHRSILASPSVVEHRDRVNRVKRRERWRPFAPALLAEESRYLFGRDIDSPYMQMSFTLTDCAVAEYPAIAHVDQTARPQTVQPGTGPYADLLCEMRDQNGHGVVLNTSFNGPGEPIVCTPEDAIRAFATMPLDALIIENFLIARKGLES